MSFEKRAESWALSLVDALESPAHNNVRLAAAAAAIVITICMWAVHLLNPEIFTFFLDIDDWHKLFLGFVFAPPFVVAYTLGSFVYPQPIETNESGPMSAYFYRDRASRRWKLLIVAAIIAALNFVLVLATSGI